MSGRLDLNQRPHDPQSCALPDCATSRINEYKDTADRPKTQPFLCYKLL